MFGFSLDGDDASQGNGRLIFIPAARTNGEEWIRVSLYDFLAGMTPGSHEFTGHWYAPCSVAAELGLWDDPCLLRPMPVEAWTATPTVTFLDADIPLPADTDSDGVPDVVGNCPTVPNPNHAEDGDGVGDACQARAAVARA